jgi:uncharacterized protein (UPF0335 family)
MKKLNVDKKELKKLAKKIPLNKPVNKETFKELKNILKEIPKLRKKKDVVASLITSNILSATKISVFDIKAIRKIVAWYYDSQNKSTLQNFFDTTTIPKIFKKSNKKLYRIMYVSDKKYKDITQGKPLKLRKYSSWTTLKGIDRFRRTSYFKKMGRFKTTVIFVIEPKQKDIFINLVSYLKSTQLKKSIKDFYNEKGLDGYENPKNKLLLHILKDRKKGFIPEVVLKNISIKEKNIYKVYKRKT